MTRQTAEYSWHVACQQTSGQIVFAAHNYGIITRGLGPVPTMPHYVTAGSWRHSRNSRGYRNRGTPKLEVLLK